VSAKLKLYDGNHLKAQPALQQATARVCNGVSFFCSDSSMV